MSSPDEVERRLVSFYDAELPQRATRPAGPERVAAAEAFIAYCAARGLTSVVEVGCGPARDGVRFRDAGLAYAGVDVSPVGVELCRAAGLTALVASAIELPFADNAFDAGWSMSTLMHLAGDGAEVALAELARVVRPGGVFEVGVWGHDRAETQFDEHGRLFELRTDEQLRALAAGVGTVEAFGTWDRADTGFHYQWVRVVVG